MGRGKGDQLVSSWAGQAITWAGGFLLQSVETLTLPRPSFCLTFLGLNMLICNMDVATLPASWVFLRIK